jgi:hypothetical protein
MAEWALVESSSWEGDVVAPGFDLHLAGPWVPVRRLGRDAVSDWFEVHAAGGPGGREPFVRGLMRCFTHERLRAVAVLELQLTEELWVAGLMRHPRVQQLLERLPSTSWGAGYVVERTPGVTLRRMLGECGPVPLAAVLEIARRLCDVLGDLHGQRDAEGRSLEAVHRRVTLDDAWLTMQHGRGEVRLLNPGLGWPNLAASPGGSVAPQQRAFDGLSPEQVRGLVLDAASDVHQVAHLALALLLGRPPCARDTMMATLRAVQELSPSTIDWQSLRLPAGLEALLAQALSPVPPARPGAAELGNGFAGILDRLGADGSIALDRHVSEVLARCPTALCGMPSGPAG